MVGGSGCGRWWLMAWVWEVVADGNGCGNGFGFCSGFLMVGGGLAVSDGGVGW